MLIIALLIQLLVLAEMRYRMRGFTPQETFGWFLWLSQIVYLNGDWIYGPQYNPGGWETYSYLHHPETQIIYYGSIILVLWVSTIGVGRLTGTTAGISESLTALRDQARKYDTVFKFLVGSIIGAQWVFLNWPVAWYNTQYLAMTGQGSMWIEGPAVVAIQSMAGMTGFISAFYLANNLSQRGGPIPFVWLVLFVWNICFSVAACSRASFAILMVFTLLMHLVSDRKSNARTLILTAAAIYLLFCALAGRGAGEFGLESIPTILIAPFEGESNGAVEVVGSIFQGVFITGDGNEFRADFPLIYKILSFSPLPSTIDGFPVYREQYEILLSAFVPMSGYTEIIGFGVGYLIFLWGFVAILMRKLVLSQKKIGLLYFILSCTVLFFLIQGGTYPIRNFFRPLLFAYLITVYLSRRKGAKVLMKI
ncbi:hypothetical protein [Novosphingobium sp. KACC 22771]|uniref:hypothetical protein n=1 Tax=Novosphingobium sp. KACC 22771 TaxID=3025670 RepID=UPI002366B362|nr:hypothetical protein [Novosphingobium sp. KACC 22771]WDF72871.1 hypothetical protein PQ467_02175 [Novosphingobium sp. KACC 22771]